MFKFILKQNWFSRRTTNKKKFSFCVAGSRESRGSRDSNSVEVLSAPTSPSEQQDSNQTMNSQIGRNPLRSSKCMHHTSHIHNSNIIYYKEFFF